METTDMTCEVKSNGTEAEPKKLVCEIIDQVEEGGERVSVLICTEKLESPSSPEEPEPAPEEAPGPEGQAE